VHDRMPRPLWVYVATVVLVGVVLSGTFSGMDIAMPAECGRERGSMIAFEVTINGNVISTAGVGEFGFLFTEVMWNKHNPALRPKDMPEKEWVGEELKLRL